MKKGFSVILLLLLNLPVFSQTVIPDSLSGIWEGKDRFIFFENKQNNENSESDFSDSEIVILLKEYYGWYYDRAAEPEEYDNREKRLRNSATHKTPEHISFSVNTINKNDYSNAWEIQLNYSKHESNRVPVLVLDDKMFLDFYIRDNKSLENYNGIWSGNIVSEGIKICSQEVPENIRCFYVNENLIFNIRYWKSKMEYNTDSAFFEYDSKQYDIDKHIFSAGNNYSCTNGRGKQIRNLSEPEVFNPESYIFNSEKTVMICDKEPYLIKLADKRTLDDLFQIVKKANARRKPNPDPLFAEKELDWHWDVIDYLEKNNSLIQSVRERQKSFGKRGKDLGK